MIRFYLVLLTYTYTAGGGRAEQSGLKKNKINLVACLYWVPVSEKTWGTGFTGALLTFDVSNHRFCQCNFIRLKVWTLSALRECSLILLDQRCDRKICFYNEMVIFFIYFQAAEKKKAPSDKNAEENKDAATLKQVCSDVFYRFMIKFLYN